MIDDFWCCPMPARIEGEDDRTRGWLTGDESMNDDRSGVVCLADLRHHRMNLGEK